MPDNDSCPIRGTGIAVGRPERAGRRTHTLVAESIGRSIWGVEARAMWGRERIVQREFECYKTSPRVLIYCV